MDMLMDYRVLDAMLEHNRRHNAKAGQHHAELKAVLSTIKNDLLHEFIDKAIVSFCIRFGSCVAATGGTDIVSTQFK